MANTKQNSQLNVFQWPLVGTMLTALSGLSFLVVCMILPLVGRSGAAAPHTGRNFVTFLGVVLLSLGLGVLALISKMERRKVDGSPLPYLSLGLCAATLVLLVALLTGLLHV